MKRTLRLGLVLVALLAAITVKVGAGETALVVSADSQRLDLGPAIAVLEDLDDKLTLADVRAADTRFRADLAIGRYPTATWWLRIRVRANETGTWWLDSGERYAAALSVYAPDDAGVYREQTASGRRPFAERPLATYTLVFPLALVAGQHTDIFLRLQASSGASATIHPVLWQPDAYREATQRQDFAFIFYLGMAAALGLFNLLLGLAIRDRLYFYYVLNLAVFVWAADSTNAADARLYAWLWPESPYLFLMSWTLSAAAIPWTMNLFVGRFVDLKRHAPGGHRFLFAFAVFYTMVMGIFLTTFWPWPSLVPFRAYPLVTQAVFPVYIGAMLYVLGTLAWRGQRSARLFLIAFLPLLLVGIAQPLSRALGIVVIPWPVPPIMIGSGMEMLLMSLVLADRFNETRKAKERAQAEALATAKRAAEELEAKVEVRTHELSEALKQQQATAEVLQLISRTHFDLDAVLQTLIDKACQLIGANAGILLRPDNDDNYLPVVNYGYGETEAATMQLLREHPIRPGTDTATGRAVLEKRTVQIADVFADTGYRHSIAQTAATYRAIIAVPMLRDGQCIGVIAMGRAEPRAFEPGEVVIVTGFAHQAAIAIENVRLFTEIEARNADLAESLKQQQATAEVLQLISRTHFDLAPVLQTLLENAATLCDADSGILLRPNAVGDFVPEKMYAGAAVASQVEKMMALLRAHPIRPGAGSSTGRAALEKRPIHIPDIRGEPGYRADVAEIAVFRSILAVPMLRDDECIGVLAISRVGAPRPFSDKQIRLATTFADQAVIAVENVRLFTAIADSNRDLTESLKQQQATAEVLQLISRTHFDLEPVLQTLIERACELCDADGGYLYRPDEQGRFLPAAMHARAVDRSVGERLLNLLRSKPIVAGDDSVAGRAVKYRRVASCDDIRADSSYRRDIVDATRARTLLAVPILRNSDCLGILTIGSIDVVRPFTQKQIDLACTFADQAAIAIENVRLFREIEDKNRQLELADRHKSDFLATMSHEIRTPMNAIIGLADLALRGELAPKARDYVAKIHRSGLALLGILNDILDFSKIEAGKLDIEHAPFALADTIGHVETVCAQKVADKGLVLRIAVAPEVPAHLNGDALRLGQVLVNLVGNAIKFTERGTVDLHVGVEAADAGATTLNFNVRDTGIGMSAEQIDKLFAAFTQADSSTSRKYGGTGLGLSISRRLVELMGGAMQVESVPGAGTTFRVRLPFGLADVAAAAGAKVGADGTALPYVDARALLVEDNEINQQIAVELLATVGIAVDVAGSGPQALQRLQAQPPGHYDLILMDLQMPGMDGHATTAAIRADACHAATPIVAMSAHALGDIRQRCLAEGMQDYLPKPVQPARLFQTVARFVGHKALSRAVSTAAAPTAEVPDDLAALRTLDAAAGLRQMNGDAALFRAVLQRFGHSQTDAAAQLRAALGAGDRAGARRLAHTLKGLAGSIGASAVQAQAAALEAALAEDDGDAIAPPLRALTEALTVALDDVLAELNDASATATPTGAVLVPPSGDATAALIELRGLLTTFSGKCGDCFARHRTLLAPLLPGERLAELERHIAGFDFEAALTLLEPGP